MLWVLLVAAECGRLFKWGIMVITDLSPSSTPFSSSPIFQRQPTKQKGGGADRSGSGLEAVAAASSGVEMLHTFDDDEFPAAAAAASAAAAMAPEARESDSCINRATSANARAG